MISKRQLIYSIAIGATLAIIVCFFSIVGFEEVPWRLKFIYLAVIPIITVGAFIIGTSISYLCFVIINIIFKKQTIFSLSNIPALIIIIIIVLGVSYLYSDICRMNIAEDPETTNQELIELYSKNKNNSDIQLALARNESTPKHVLRELVKKYSSMDVLYGLAINKNTPPDALAEIENLAVDRYNSSCDLKHKGISICLTKWWILTRLAYNDSTPPEMLRRIANLLIDDNPHILSWRGTGTEYCLYKDGTIEGFSPVLDGIRGNPNTPADVKQMVSEHIDNLPERCRFSKVGPNWAHKIELERYRQLQSEQETSHPLIVGTWQRPIGCNETATFKNNNTFVSISNEEVINGNYTFQFEKINIYRLTTTYTTDNKKPDCSGRTENDVGKTRTLYVRFSDGGNTLYFYRSAEGGTPYYTFKKK